MIKLTRGCDVGHSQPRAVPGIGPITTLTWGLEMGTFLRFRSIRPSHRFLRALVPRDSGLDSGIGSQVASSHSTRCCRLSRDFPLRCARTLTCALVIH